MTTGSKPPAEITIGLSLVRALLEEQHLDLAQLPLIDIGEGWDNKLFRLGDELAVRLPRRAASAALIEQEQRWLPQLSPRLPLPVCNLDVAGLGAIDLDCVDTRRHHRDR